ncbi:MAG TPA: tRNA adenosine(34) deaminase TadA [Desulfatirhabdiaceae bacterium]|nr:tRNA adenosine(34) deaminase TadA [Desulfatirhabdiaceae bacterium]
MQSHSFYMKLALEKAMAAATDDEVPVGAVIVSASGDILAASHNQTISCCDATAHAEMMAIREACLRVGNYRLLNTMLYVTIEPCVMCMGAVIHARIAAVIFGAKDPKWGACGSLYHLGQDVRFNHHPEVISGVCEDECKTIIQSFFKSKRKYGNEE